MSAAPTPRVEGINGVRGRGALALVKAASSGDRPRFAPLLTRLLSLGATPVLVATDLVAYAVADILVEGTHVAFAFLLAVLLLLNASGGYYSLRLSPSVLDDAPGFMGRALVAGAFATTFKVLTNDPVGDRLIYAALLFVVIALPLRAVANVAVRRLRRTGYISHATLIIGAGQVGSHLASLLLEHREYGLRPVGFLNRDRLVRRDAPIPMLGRVDELSRVLVEHRIRNVVVAFGAAPESGLIDILRTCDRLRCEIFLVPRLYELHAVNRDMELVWGFPLARLRRAPFRTLTWRLKRVFDIVLAGLAFVALLPVLAICAVLVRLDGGPGVIFRQERVGLDGRAFQVLKFRTLRPASEAESASTWSVSDDARLRPVGRALRRTSLDELPQLWNVLRGDMSLVGPRPERPFFVNVFTEQFPRYMARHRVPAGLTGWAQVHGLRGDTSIADRARFDNYYIENWSMWEDVKILLRTVGQVARAAGR